MKQLPTRIYLQQPGRPPRRSESEQERSIDTIEGVKISHLPETARFIVRALGMEAAALLIEHFGGQTMRIPKAMNQQSAAKVEAFADVIGLEATAALIDEFSGETLYIPSCKDAMRNARNEAIHSRFDALVKAGHSANEAVAEIARSNRISNRRVWVILKELPQ